MLHEVIHRTIAAKYTVSFWSPIPQALKHPMLNRFTYTKLGPNTVLVIQ